MNTAGEMFETAIEHWRDAKGIGTALIPSVLNDKIMVLGVLQRIYARSPTCEVVIITNTFNERQEIIEFLTNQEDEDNNKEFKEIIKNRYIKVLTIDYINGQKFHTYPFCSIIYHPDKAHQNILNYLMYSKFKLVVMNRLLGNSIETAAFYKICPILDDFKQNEIEEIRLSTPVEEIQIGVTIPSDSNAREELDKCNEYITTSIAIFGSFDIMQQARLGNTVLNISANQICAQIAQENGWNERLDMSIEFNREIDNLYNPINLKERASKTYEIIRNRSQLLSDYDDKLDKILEIVRDNPDKKILIINKRGDFANKVTDFLNQMSETSICGNYHDRVDPIPAIDMDGNPVYVKSGARKGERRMLAAQAQRTLNLNRFIQNKINVLSTNNAPDRSLCIDVDIVIITSTQCESIRSYIYRLSGVNFNPDKLSLYTLYCKNTMEEKLLTTREQANNHKIINNCENFNISEENSDFIVVD